MLGWLVAKPLRHITMLSDLTTPEAVALGPLIQRVAAALGQVLRPEKVYSVLFSEQREFSHIHFHLIPRPADLPTELRGPGVFRLLERARIDGNLADPSHAAAVAARISALLRSNG